MGYNGDVFFFPGISNMNLMKNVDFMIFTGMYDGDMGPILEIPWPFFSWGCS